MIGYAPRGRGVLMAQNAFNAQSRTVVDLLGSNAPLRLVVPIFQRGYSWEAKHVKAFWDDLTDSNRPIKYFMGPIVVLEKPEDGISELLDGQQRLATITILFSVIRDAASRLGFQEAEHFSAYIQRDFIIGEEGRRNIQLGETDDAYFMELIQQLPKLVSGKTPKKPKRRSHRFVFEARAFLADVVTKALTGKDSAESLKYLRGLRDYVRHNLILACITVTSDDDAFQIFETLNDRGLRLSTPDLLLNFLMRQAKDEERKHIRLIWDEMLAEMGRRDISRFLRHLWVSQYGDLKAEGLFAALKAAIKKSAVSSLSFVQQCSEECRSYVALLDVRAETLGVAEPYIRKLIKGIDAQSALPLLLSCMARFSLTEVASIAQFLLVFIVRWMILTGRDTARMETLLFSLARDVRTGEISGKTVSVSEVKNSLRGVSPDDTEVTAAISRMVLPADSAEYVVRCISNSMETKTKEKTTGDESNLEHIYPQNPDDGAWGGEDNQAILEPYTWHIGNLTMLGERLNTKAKNSEYEAKREKYKASELKMPQLIAEKYDKWDAPSIEDRAKSLLPNILKIWNFDNPSGV